jgi:hypothetical protein
MSLTTQNLETCSLHALQKSHTDATVYTAFFEPKSQSDAVKMIHGKKSTSNINIKPISQSREKLTTLGFIENIESNKLRGPKHKSSTKPIINSIKKRIDVRRSKHQFSDQYFPVLEKILDSNWFRSFYSMDFMRTISRTNAEFYHVYLYRTITDKNKLEVNDPVNLFTFLIEDIGAYSFFLTTFLKQNSVSTHTIEKIFNEDNFDQAIENLSHEMPQKIIDLYFSYCVLEKKYQDQFRNRRYPIYNVVGIPQKVIERIKIGAPFIPHEIAEDMMFAGRIPGTLISSLPQMVKQLEEENPEIISHFK